MKKEAIEISIDLVTPNRYQPRLEFNQESLMELAQSIRENGLIQPIVVRKIGNTYEIVAGERRFRACILAGFTSVSAIVTEANDEETAELALVENIQREDLSAIEEAKAYLQVMQSQNITQEEMAKRMGKSQSTIANKIRLLQLDETVQEAVSTKRITERHARAMLSVPKEKQTEILDKVVENKWNVNQTEKFVDVIQNKTEEKKKPLNKGFSRNQKLGINTINQAITMIRNMGIEVNSEEVETDEDIRIIIKFPK